MLQEKVKDVLQAALLYSGQSLIAKGPEASIEILRKTLGKLPSLDNTARARYVDETSDTFINRVLERVANRDKIIGIKTGFYQIDEHIRGIKPQWLTVVMGRNGQYKSYVASQMIMKQWLEGKNIVLYSCEMSLEEFESRIYSLALKIPPYDMDNGNLTSGQLNDIKEFAAKVKNGEIGGKLIIDDQPIDLDNIRLHLANVITKHSVDVVYIDSAYLLRGSGSNEREQLNSIANGCKVLAKEFNLPVIVTIQANREFMKNNQNAKKETSGAGMSAAGTDAWNQVADLIFIVHRREEYEPYHYSDFLMEKARHSAKIPFMLRINLKEPIIEVVDREQALKKVANENPVAQEQTDTVFKQTTESFQAFKQHDIEEYTMDIDEDEEGPDAS